MKILTILGARPQFIKAGSVSRELKKKGLNEVIVHTGQHYDSNMSDVFFEQMQIPKPDYFLGVKATSHAKMTGQMMEKIEEVVLKEQPDMVIVYGDTNSTLAGALVASKLNTKLVHIEAGLRSFNNKMPEEINRIVTDRLSQILFCPTKKSVQNLEKEGFNNLDVDVVQCGDVMQDGAIFYQKFAKKPDFETPEKFAICTVHRAENTDDKRRLASIFEALETISNEQQIVLPLHPRTKKMITQYSIDIPKNIVITPPIGYLEMVWLLMNCELVLTDSGGLQKEAFFFQKPCITLRDETEWVELIEHKFNILTGANTEKIVSTFCNREKLFSKKFEVNLYGKGLASKIIANKLLNIQHQDIVK